MEESMNISKEVAMVWSIANKLRGPYKSDKYKDVIIPMVIIRRFECALSKTKKAVLEEYEKDKTTPAKILCQKSGYSFYNTSKFDLKELLNDSEHIAANFKSYINGFSANIKEIIDNLSFSAEIDKMDKNNRLLGVIKDFSNLDLNPETISNHKMGYIFEDIIRRFSENAEAGDHFTPREVIKLMVDILLSEGSDDLMAAGKTVTILDAACGTGGMLSTARDAILKMNPDADIQLFGQEVNPESYAICLADMMIKGQNANNIKFQDTMIKDSFEATVNKPEQKMRYVIMNPPFGQPWGGKDAAEGVEKAVNEEYKKGYKGRFGAGLPGTGDMQLLFMQHAISKLDDNGKAAIITNGSPLFSGGTSSGESQIRRYMIEQDLIEAIIALPTDLFYNTNIGIYVFILSKEGTKRKDRRGKIQLINATSEEFWTQLRKSLGKKRKELSPKQIEKIVKIYADFKENKYCKIFDKEEFLYREYAVYQPLQRNYAITDERIENMLNSGCLSNLYDPEKMEELQLLDPIPAKEKKQLDKYLEGKPIYEEIIKLLKNNVSNKIYKKESDFLPVIKNVLKDIDKKIIDKIIDGLSEMDKTAEIHKDKKGEIILDKSTKDTEIVKFNKDIKEYMNEEVLPHVPDAIYQFEEDLDAKKPIIKTGAEFPFARYFYEYRNPNSSSLLMEEFSTIENNLSKKRRELFSDLDTSEYKMKKSGIEWIDTIPQSWEIKHLKNVCCGFNNGTSEEQLLYGESEYPVSRIETISEGIINYDKVGYIEKENKKFILDKDDFLVSNINSIAYLGNCAIYNGEKKLYHGMNLLRIKPQNVNPIFLKHYFKSICFRRNMQIMCKPAINQASVSATNIKAMKIPIPSNKEQEIIGKTLDEQIEKIDSVLSDLKNEINLLEEYKTSLIYEYVTGKKRVKGAEELYG